MLTTKEKQLINAANTKEYYNLVDEVRSCEEIWEDFQTEGIISTEFANNTRFEYICFYCNGYNISDKPCNKCTDKHAIPTQFYNCCVIASMAKKLVTVSFLLDDLMFKLNKYEIWRIFTKLKERKIAIHFTTNYNGNSKSNVYRFNVGPTNKYNKFVLEEVTNPLFLKSEFPQLQQISDYGFNIELINDDYIVLDFEQMEVTIG